MSDVPTLVRVSRLYYELGETQGQIASRLGVTRPQVSKLLKQARAEGIVEVRIHDSDAVDEPLARTLAAQLGLRAVHLAASLDGAEDLTRRAVGRVAGQVVRAAIRDGSVVGVGDGAAVSAMADAFPDAPSPVAATIVPLCGGYWHAVPAHEPYRRIAQALGATAYGLLAPGIVDDAATKSALVRHAGIRAVLDLWDRLDVAVLGIGGRGWSGASLGPDVAAELDARRAVGEVLIAPFDLDGRFVARDLLAPRTIAFDPTALRRVPLAIGIASGGFKVEPILGSVRAGAINTLVTDVATAEAVLALDDETREAPMPEVRS